MTALNSPLYILGAGSIGLLFAASIRLTNPSFPVRLLLRPTHIENLKKYGQTLNINHFNDRIIFRTSCKIPIVTNHSSHAQQNPNERYSSPVRIKDDTYILVALKSRGRDTIEIIDVPAEIVLSQQNESAEAIMPIIQHVLLTTKAQDATRAVASISHRFHPSGQTQIIVVSNGTLALMDELRKNGIHAHITSASTTHGANPGAVGDFHEVTSLLGKSCRHVIHAGVGSVYLEKKGHTEMLDLSQKLQSILNTSGLNSLLRTEEEMNIIHWKKLVANCTINPLTALRRVLNGQILESSGLHSGESAKRRYMDSNILSELVKELSQVAQAEVEGRPQALSFKNLFDFVHTVIRDTAYNRSSMLQDIENHRSTEINYLNAYAVRLGGKHGLTMDANNYILREVQLLERTMCTTTYVQRVE